MLFIKFHRYDFIYQSESSEISLNTIDRLSGPREKKSAAAYAVLQSRLGHADAL